MIISKRTFCDSLRRIANVIDLVLGEKERKKISNMRYLIKMFLRIIRKVRLRYLFSVVRTNIRDSITVSVTENVFHMV